jgi:hypothetical protein
LEATVSDEFKIDVEWLEGSDGDPVERSSFAQIIIDAAQQTTTELEDLFARTIRPGLRASAYDLAMWFAENWWRLRWEPEAKTVDWRLSHVVAAVAGGVAWPNVSFASDSVHVLVEARRTLGGRGAPVRYIRDVDVQISAASFEAGIDEFIERVLARLSSVNVGETDLALLWRQLLADRHDQEIAARRRLEALMGFDQEEAPEALIASLRAATNDVGCGAIDEMAAAAKVRAFEALQSVLERASKSGVSIHIDSASSILRQYSGQTSSAELPWQRATVAARLARDVWGVGRGPVSNDELSELLSIPTSFLEYAATNGLPVAAGLRTKHGTDDVVSVVMRAKMPTGRRFELMRLVADHIVAPSDDCLLPVTAEKTDRQKFQRAFAQEFLLPFAELYEQLGSPQATEDEISNDDIEDISMEYNVSPLLARTVLVNRGFLPRDALLAAQ